MALKNILQKNRGASIVEALLAAALFGLIVTALMGTVLFGETSTYYAGNRIKATYLAEEGIEAVRNIQEASFSDVQDLGDGVYSLSTSSGSWTLGIGTETTSIFSREIEVEEIDGDTIEVTSRVTWNDIDGRDGLVAMVTRFTNWLQNAWMQTTSTEFLAGFLNGVQVTNTAGGEITFAEEGSWTDPSIYLLENIGGNQDVDVLALFQNSLWVGRANSTLYYYDISDISNGNITLNDSYGLGANPTGVVVDGENAYVSTVGNNNDLVIFDRDSEATTAINIPGTHDTTDIALFGTQLAITKVVDATDAEVFFYDTSGVLTGRVQLGDIAYAVEMDANYAYVGTGLGTELYIIDYNDCTGGGTGDECTVVQTYNPANGGGSDMTALHLVGSNLYAGRANNRVHGFDVSDITGITAFLDVDPGNDAITAIFADEFAGIVFVTTTDANNEEFAIINIATGAETTLNLDGAAGANDLVKLGTYVYVGSDDADEIQIIQAGVGGWSAPEQTDTYDTTGTDNANDVFVLGDYAYLGTDDDFWVFDISDVTNIQLEDTIDLNYDVKDIYVVGDFAYLATENNTSELVVFNVSDPSNISQVGTYNADSGANGEAVWVEGSTVYLGTTNNNGGSDPEFYVLTADTSNPSNVTFTLEGDYDVTANVWDIHMNGTTAYLGTSVASQEFLILDASTPGSITEVGSVDIAAGQAFGVFYDTNRAFLGTTNGGGSDDFHVFDVSNPAAPSLFASINTATNIRDVKVDGNLAFLATDQDTEGVTIFDISDVGSGILTELGVFDTAGDCNGLHYDTATDNVFYACESNTIELSIYEAAVGDVVYPYEAWFTSQEFDSGSGGTTWTSLLWDQSGLGGFVAQMRTAPDSGGSPGTWTRWLGPTSVEDFYVDQSGGTAINTEHADGFDDQWLQVRFSGTTTASTTAPVLNDFSVTYN